MSQELERMVARARKRYREKAENYLRARNGGLIDTLDAAAERPPSYRSSDAWLLLAIQTAQDGDPFAELAEIIAAGDAINHAIFADAELQDGFSRLVRGGYVDVDGALCALTDKFQKVWNASRAGKARRLDKQREALEKMLDVSQS